MAGHNSISIKSRTLHPEFLSGWKDIASYLGKGVRTVQRYELVFRLPVRRPGVGTRGSVIASRVELEQWVQAGPTMSPNRVQLDSKQVHNDLRAGMYEMYRLCNAAYGLRKAVGRHCAALHSGVQALVRNLGEPSLSQKMERHKAIATEQKVRARGMIKIAREMSDRAVEMRNQTVSVVVDC